MSIFEDNSSHRLSRADAETAIANTEALDTNQRAYIQGYFDAIDDTTGIRGDTIERALDQLRDKSSDGITASEAQYLRESFEAIFTESLS